MITKKDYAIVALVGFFTGVFAVPTLANLDIRSYMVLIALPAVAAALFVVGLAAGKILSRIAPFFSQFSKFAAVGFLNTAIDFGVLNILSIATGVTEGFKIGGVNVPGFVVAVFNGYLWNQLWVFQARNKDEGLFHDFPNGHAFFFLINIEISTLSCLRPDFFLFLTNSLKPMKSAFCFP